MRTPLLVCLSLGLWAQAPGPVPFDEAFFAGDRRLVLQGCADKARALKPKDAKFLAECGRAYLAALEGWGETSVRNLLRAIEARRWMIRAANDGVSAVISPAGEVVELDATSGAATRATGRVPSS